MGRFGIGAKDLGKAQAEKWNAWQFMFDVWPSKFDL